MSNDKIRAFNEDGHVVWMTRHEYDAMYRQPLNTNDAFIRVFNEDGHTVWIKNPNYKMNESKEGLLDG